MQGPLWAIIIDSYSVLAGPKCFILGGGFTYVIIVHPYIFGEMISILTNIFQLGWNVETTN